MHFRQLTVRLDKREERKNSEGLHGVYMFCLYCCPIKVTRAGIRLLQISRSAMRCQAEENGHNLYNATKRSYKFYKYTGKVPSIIGIRAARSSMTIKTREI